MTYKQKEAPVAAKAARENSFHLVVLKHRNQKYYLADYKLTISLDKSSAMIFLDEELALDYATKVENFYSYIMNQDALGYTEDHSNINAFSNLSYMIHPTVDE